MIIWEDFDENTNHQFPIQIIQINQAAKSILALQDSNDMQDYVRQLSKLKIINKNKYINLIAGMKRLTELNQDDYIYEIQFLDDSKKSVEISTKFNIIPNIHFTIFRDVTERLKMEDQLRKSDMLNVIGELAAGVAHEIRNPLTSLKGFIQLLKGNVDGYSMYFNIIMAELDRIDSIVNEFLVLAKPQVVQYKHFNIVKIMQETIELLYPQAMMDNIQFQTNFEDLYLFSYCEPNQIKQVFINIVKNAIEVSKKGGNIYISLRIVDDRFIKISITDEGEGISEDKLKRLGQPFYTTKERGTGLGLMVSYKIIKEHGGRIEVESELGKGTTFHVFLPKK